MYNAVMPKGAFLAVPLAAVLVISLLPLQLIAETPVRTALGIDVDFYTGPISHDVWQRLKEANHKFLVAQAWGGRSQNEFAASQLAGARSIGMKTAAYVLLNYDDKVCPTFAKPLRDARGKCAGDLILQTEPGGRWQVQQGITALGKEFEKVAFIAIDIEWFVSSAPPSHSTAQAHRRQYILDALNEIQRYGKKAVIYTRNGTGHWLDITGCEATSSEPECTALYKRINDSALPIALWDVEEGAPTLDSFRPHGEWVQRLGRQYKLDKNVFGLPPGRTVDLNVFDMSLFVPEASKQPSKYHKSTAKSPPSRIEGQRKAVRRPS